MQNLKNLSDDMLNYCCQKHSLDNPPAVNFEEDEVNARNFLAKTAFYDPNTSQITVYVSSRHPKDILRSIAHEFIHHLQNLRGEFKDVGYFGSDYAQKDMHMRKMEKEAYLNGNMMFRDWEDGLKHSTKIKLNEEINMSNDNNDEKINTPEKENDLYEKRFGDRNQKLFDKLKKTWTKKK